MIGWMEKFESGNRRIAHQVPDLYAEKAGDIRQQFLFRISIAVFPVGNSSAHQAEDLVTACLGHTFCFSEGSELGTEGHRITAFHGFYSGIISLKPLNNLKNLNHLEISLSLAPLEAGCRFVTMSIFAFTVSNSRISDRDSR